MPRIEDRNKGNRVEAAYRRVNSCLRNEDCNLMNRAPIRTTIIAVTAFSNQSTLKKCERIGIKEVVNKPLTIEELKIIIDKYYYG